MNKSFKTSKSLIFGDDAIEQVFKETYNGKTNFMTPDVIKYGETKEYIYELSEGSFMNTKLFGVTILTKHGITTNLNRSFDSLKKAESYLEDLDKTDDE